MFSDTEQSLFLDLKPCNNTVDAHHSCHTLENYHNQLSNVWLNLIKASTCCITMFIPTWPTEFRAIIWEVLKHPAESPDFLTYNFHIVTPLNKVFRRHTFKVNVVGLAAARGILCRHDMPTCAHRGPVKIPVMNFLTVAIPPSVRILEWVSVVHTSYCKWLQFKSRLSTVVLSG